MDNAALSLASIHSLDSSLRLTNTSSCATCPCSVACKPRPLSSSAKLTVVARWHGDLVSANPPCGLEHTHCIRIASAVSDLLGATCGNRNRHRNQIGGRCDDAMQIRGSEP